MPSNDFQWSTVKPELPVAGSTMAATFLKFTTNTKQPISGTDPFRLTVVKIWCFAGNDPNPRTAGSGVFITDDVLLTSGHLLFNPEIFGPHRSGGYADHVRLTSPWLPIHPQAAASNRVVAAPGWVKGSSPGADVGVIKLNLPVNPAANLTPVAASNTKLANAAVRVYGFPLISQQLHYASGTCVALQSQLIFHSADVGPGESGSPLLAMISDVPALVGLHRAGPGETPSGLPPSVSAFRLTRPALNWIQNVIPLL